MRIFRKPSLAAGLRDREAGRGVLCAAALGAALASVGCGGGGLKSTGALYVTVKDATMTPVADVVVTTDPVTQQMVTDALGSVFFRNLASGFYTVTAIHPALGAARMPIMVSNDDLAELTLVLSHDVVVDAGTDGGGLTTDGRPAGGQGGSPGVGGRSGTGGFTGAGGFTGVGGRSGTGGFTGAGGFTGVGGRIGTAVGGMTGAGGSTVDPSWIVTLAVPTKDSNGVNLAWTVTGGPYPSYRVYRATGSTGSFAIIDILNSPATLTYRDLTPQLGSVYRYQIGALTAAGQEVMSDVQMITAGVFIDVASQVERMMTDPQRPYLYLVDRVNNSLHFVNLTSKTVESTIFIGSTPVDLDINPAATELAVANFGSTEIAIVDLTTRLKTRSLLVDTSLGTWDGNPYRLVFSAGNTLVFTSQDQWNNLKLVSAADGHNLTTTGSLYFPALATSPDRTRVYVAESGSTGSALHRFEVSGSTLTETDTSSYVGGYGSRQVSVTRDGAYVFYAGQKFLANNLKSILGTFSEVILLANHDGSIAVGPTKIHDGTTFGVKKMLPLSTQIMALSTDEKTLYLYDTTTSRLYLYDL